MKASRSVIRNTGVVDGRYDGVPRGKGEVSKGFGAVGGEVGGVGVVGHGMRDDGGRRYTGFELGWLG